VGRVARTSSVETDVMEGENPVESRGIATEIWRLEESGCLGMQSKMSGKFPIKLNMTARPIENKYREGKLKRTLKKELKVREIVKGESLKCGVLGDGYDLGEVLGRCGWRFGKVLIDRPGCGFRASRLSDYHPVFQSTRTIRREEALVVGRARDCLQSLNLSSPLALMGLGPLWVVEDLAFAPHAFLRRGNGWMVLRYAAPQGNPYVERM